MIVKKQKRITFINDCDAIYNEDDLREAILWYQTKPTVSQKHVYMFGNYPAVSIHKEKIHIHRLLMMYWLKAPIPNDYFVHHINKNKLDASKSNLTVVYIPVHQSYHNKGKQISDYQKQSLIERNHKRVGTKIGITKKGVTYQKIWDLYQKGFSVNKISIELNYDWAQVKLRLDEIHENPELLEVRE